jgi:hypothetical protein
MSAALRRSAEDFNDAGGRWDLLARSSAALRRSAEDFNDGNIERKPGVVNQCSGSKIR